MGTSTDVTMESAPAREVQEIFITAAAPEEARDAVQSNMKTGVEIFQ